MAAIVVLAAACATSGEAIVADRDSNVRGESVLPETVVPEGDTGPYCERAELLREGSVDLDEDPEQAAQLLGDAAELAPEQLRDEFDLMIDTLGELAQLDEDDPTAFGAVFELLLDPAVLAAMASIDQYTLDACGFTFDAEGSGSMDGLGGLGDVDMDEFGAGEFDTDEFGGGMFEDDPDAIRLTDVDAVKAANASQSWVAKVNSTSIGNGTDVQLAAMSGTLSASEALAACEALFAALSAKNPAVSVTVLNDSTELAVSDGAGCTTR